jgi:hypothetical protein
MRTITKARQHHAKFKRQCRTFVGYIGLLDGRPDAELWPTNQGLRTVHVFLNERKARAVYEDVALVTVTGIWKRGK